EEDARVFSGHPREEPVAEGDAEHRAPGVERPVESEGAAALLVVGAVGDQRIARRRAYALAQPIDDTGGQHHTPARGERQQQLAERAARIAGDRQALAAADPVRDPAREDL